MIQVFLNSGKKRKKDLILTKYLYSMRESKICPICNRPFENRKTWASRGIWEQVKYCSKKCRKIAGIKK